MCHPFEIDKINQVTQMQILCGNTASMVQVHPKYYNLFFDGERIIHNLNGHLTYSAKIDKNNFFTMEHKPKYHDDFFSDTSLFTFERPSAVLTIANDDRMIVPKLGLENILSDMITQIDVYETKYQN